MPTPGLTLNFDGGTDGASVVAGGDISAVSSPAPTYSAAAAIHGALGITATGTNAGPTITVDKPAGFTDPNGAVTLSIYYEPVTMTGGAVQIVNFQGPSNQVIGNVRANVNNGNFDVSSGAGTPLGSSTLGWVAGTKYRLDVSYAGSGTKQFTVKVFAGANIEGAVPDDTFTGTSTSAAALDHFLISPARSSAAGCVGYVDSIRVYDGLVTPDPYNPAGASGTLNLSGSGSLALSGAGDGAGTLNLSGSGTLTMSGSGAVPGSVVHSWLGAPTKTGFRVVTRTTGCTSLRLAVSTSNTMTSPTYFAAGAPDSAGYASASPSGLVAGTRYYYQWEDTPTGGSGALVGSVGRAKTLPAGNSHTIALGSCITTGSTDPAALDDVVTWDPDLFVFVGDFDYSGDQSTDPAHQRATYENQIGSAAGMTGLLRDVPWVYATSDHEAGPDNGDSNNAYTAANITAYKQIVPTYPLADTRTTTVGRYQSWVIGRVRYILLDIRNTDRSPGANADDASKTMLGATQKAWLKSQLLMSEPVKVILSDVAWMGAASLTNGADKWWSYSTERQELIDFIAANNVNVVLMHGDTHALGVATPAKNTWGGFPVYCGSPMHNVGGGRNLSTFSAEYNNAGGACRQYMRITVTDTGDAITFTASGWDASAGVERIAQTDTFTTTASGAVDLDGSGTLTFSVSVAITATLELAGSGELTFTAQTGRKVFVGPTQDYIYSLLPQYPQAHLFGVNRMGLIVYREADTGLWNTSLMLSPAERDSADLVYEGGYAYELTDDEADVLTAAGFGDYITEAFT